MKQELTVNTTKQFISFALLLEGINTVLVDLAEVL